jgi:hypothetical protein
MTEWHDPELFVPMGLWDLVADGGGLRREANVELLAELERARCALDLHLGCRPSAHRITDPWP